MIKKYTFLIGYINNHDVIHGAELYQAPKKLTAEKSMGMSFFAACPLTGGLSVPRKSGHTCNADLTSMQHSGRCPDLSGSACALLIRHETKKDIPMLNHIVSFIYNPEAKRQGHLLSSNQNKVTMCQRPPLHYNEQAFSN
jgi:hypothetical protein